MPLVSILVTSYNHEKYLSCRMDSVLAQTYPNTEIIAIDDCSTQSNREILAGYADHEKVRLVLKDQNSGLVPIMNEGIGLCKGKFILVAQCDDDCEPTLVEELVKGMINNPGVGIVFSRSLLIDENDRVIGNDFDSRERSFRRLCTDDVVIDKAQMSRFLLNSCVIPNLSATLFRRDCFEVAGLFTTEYRVCVDWELFFRFARHYDFYYVAKPLNRFRQHKATVRSVAGEKVNYSEFFRLLLGEINRQNLTFLERMIYRNHVMYLWSLHLLSPTGRGIVNFRGHLSEIFRKDKFALFFLPTGVLTRLVEITRKMFTGRVV